MLDHYIVTTYLVFKRMNDDDLVYELLVQDHATNYPFDSSYAPVLDDVI